MGDSTTCANAISPTALKHIAHASWVVLGEKSLNGVRGERHTYMTNGSFFRIAGNMKEQIMIFLIFSSLTLFPL